MTAIAYRDGIVAADSSVYDGAILTSANAQKIFRRRDGTIAAISGDAVMGDEFVRFFMGGGDLNFASSGKSNDDFFRALIFYFENKEIWFACNTGRYRMENVDFYAIGMAQEFLLGAMAAGANAEAAVRLSIERHAYCAGDVQVVRVW